MYNFACMLFFYTIKYKRLERINSVMKLKLRNFFFLYYMFRTLVEGSLFMQKFPKIETYIRKQTDDLKKV